MPKYLRVREKGGHFLVKSAEGRISTTALELLHVRTQGAKSVVLLRDTTSTVPKTSLSKSVRELRTNRPQPTVITGQIPTIPQLQETPKPPASFLPPQSPKKTWTVLEELKALSSVLVNLFIKLGEN